MSAIEAIGRGPLPLLERARGITAVTDDVVYDVAGTTLAELRSEIVAVHGRMAVAIQEAHARHKALTAERAATCKPYETEAARLAALISSYAALREASRREAEARMSAELAQAAEAAGVPADRAEEMRVSIPQLGAPEGMVEKRTWAYEITDANAIPREYMVPDEAKIAAVVRALGDKANIPGIRVMPKVTLSRKAGS